MPSLAFRLSLAVAASSCVTALTFASPAAAAPPAPSGAHPRILLTPTVLAAMKAKLGDSKSWAAQMVAFCENVGSNPSKYADGQYYGQEWTYAVSACGAAYQLTGNSAYAASGLTMWSALLNDSDTVGDGKGGDAVVQSDDGYPIRTYAAYAAIAYDWLHDAPNASPLVTASQERFKAWISWYDQNGYMVAMPGSNYHAGYSFAKAMVGIAASGEDDGTAATYFAAAVDTLFMQEISGQGLGDGGSLVGGDWPEGWEYGQLASLEYALGAHALEEQGASLPAIDAWTGQLAVKYPYSLTPDQTGMYIGGDWNDNGTYANPVPCEPLFAVLAGSGSSAAASWAQSLVGTVANQADVNLLNNALAEARGATAADFTTQTPAPPLFYFAPGTRNLYARSSWDKTGFWGVLTSAPRLGPDHQHLDASNFVFSRGADALVVDPSPYGSLSSLTSNAMTVDSQTVESDYEPSQSPESQASMLVGEPSGSPPLTTDVPYARRDWTFLPEGEIVLIDRVNAQTSAQKTYLRFRSLAASLTLSSGSPWTATGTVGGSQVVIHAVGLSAGMPVINPIAANTNGCDQSENYGTCTAARFAVSEYSLTIPSSPALAIHVIDGLGSGESPATVAALDDPSVDTTPAQNGAVVGASVLRSGVQSYVVAASSTNGAAGATLTYGVPGTAAGRHVVFDAPADASGSSTVTTSSSNGRCAITIAAGGTFTGQPLVLNVDTAANGCKATESPAPPPVSAGAGNAGTGSSGGASGSAGAGAKGSCSCDVPGGVTPAAGQMGLAGLTGLALLLAGRRRRR
jgi:MYXO-CTERM domain-containing protein